MPQIDLFLDVQNILAKGERGVQLMLEKMRLKKLSL